MSIVGTTGDDTLTGTSSNDTFNVSQGGNDTINALDGNDVINFGATLTAADKVNGGTGSDTVIIAGNYSAPLTFAATTLTAVEVLKLTAGNSYNLVMNDANVAGGQTLAINGSLLGATDVLTFNGSAETNGFYRVEAGAADDAITMGAALRGKDTIDGGAGNDTLFVGGGDYSLAFAAATLHNVENFVMAGGHDYHFVTNDTSIGAGDTMNVDATAVGAGHTVIFNGVREADGNIAFNAGAGEMELTGGAGTDSFFMTSHLTAADRIVGGAGNDTVFLGGANYSLSLQKPTLQGVEDLNLGAGFNYNLTLGGGILANATMTVDATAVGASNSFTLNALKETAGSVNVFLGAAAANIVGGQQGDAFDASPSGQATFTAADRINGEDGYDRLLLDGDYTTAAGHALVFTATTLLNVEELDADAGHSYEVTLSSKTVAAGAAFKVDASQLGAANSMTFNGAAAGATSTLAMIGGAGNDSFTGGAAADSFDLSLGGNDAAAGGAGNDSFTLGAALTAADSIDGGAGSDSVSLNGDYSAGLTLGATTLTNVETLSLAAGHSYNLTTSNANVAAGQTLTVDAGALGAANGLTFNGAAETDGSFTFIGGAGNDTLTGGNAGNSFNLTHGGTDIATSGNGANVFNLGATFDASDRLTGAVGGSNTLILNGAYSGLTVTGAMASNIQTVDIQGNNTTSLVWQGTQAAAQFTLDASQALGTLTFDDSGESAPLHFIGGALTTHITGGSGNDAFDAGTGTDNFSGGQGNDTFNMGAHLTAADQVNGGTGADTLNLNGDYSAGLTFTATTVASIAKIVVAAGHDYSLTSNDSTVASGQTTTVDASALGAANHLTFNGAAEIDGSYIFNDGAGNDVLTGGNGADTFNMLQGGTDTVSGGNGADVLNFGAKLTAADHVDGGAGSDALNLAGDYTAGNALVLGATTLANVEAIAFGAGHSYAVTTNDATVANGQAMTVDASALGVGDALAFDGSAETDGSFSFIGGPGADALTGGANADSFLLTAGGADTAHGGGGNDIFTLGAAFTAADSIDGGAGNDSVSLNGDYSAGVTFGTATITNVETLTLAAGHSYNLTTNNATVAAGQTLTVDGSGLGAGDALTVNGAAESDGAFAFLAGAGNDALTGGAQADSFTLAAGGTDTAHGGGGNDTFTLGAALTAADTIDGGAGSDTVSLNGDYSAGLSLANVTNVETLLLAAGHSYAFTTGDGTVAAGQTLTVDASAFAAANTLTVNGAAETDGAFALTGGAGNDVLTGGAGADSFDLSHGGNDTAAGGGGNDSFTLGASFTGADSIDGGTGNDSVSLNGDYSAGATLSNLTNIEGLLLAAGHSYAFTSVDATVAAGQTLTVDASALGAANTLTFNGGAETDGNLDLIGGAGNDTLTGGAAGNVFDLTHGGADAANGGGGTNVFNLGAAFDANDRINGALGGSNTLILNGAYFNLAITNAMLANIQTVDIQGSNTASFIWQQAAFVPLTVDASAAGGSLTFDFSAVNDPLHFIGGALNTHVIGGAAADTFDAGTGTDIFSGGQGADTFNFGANLTAADQINGGTGADVLNLAGDYSAGLTFTATTAAAIATITVAAGHDYSLTSNDSTVAGGTTTTVDASALGAANHLSFNGAAETDGSFAFKDGAGNDTLTGGANADSFLLTAGGADTAHGGGGNDSFTLGAAFNAGDAIDGGTGSDSLSLNGDYSAGVIFGATTLTNVETLSLAAGHSYTLTTNDTTVAAGQTLTVDGSALGAGDALTVDGSAESDGSFAFLAGAGNDTLTGGANADSFALSSGGTDTAHGGGGNDTFTLGASFTAADSIDGDAGSDSVSLNGNYSAGLTFGAATLTNVETLNLAESGSAYSLTTNDATVAAGQTLTVNAGTLTSALAFNGAAETDGSFAVAAGSGNDTLTGGAQADSFDLSLGGNDTAHGGGGNDTFSLGATFTTADAIDGGAGSDTVTLNGDYSAGITFTPTMMANVEALSLAAGHSYKFTTIDSTVASGAVLAVDGSALGASDTLTFIGTAETNGGFALTGGAGNDSLTGGAGNDSFDLSKGGNDTVAAGNGNDTIFAGALLNASDSVDGGGGSDTIIFNGDYSGGVTFANTSIQNVETFSFLAGHSYNISIGANVVPNGATLTVDGSALGAGDTLAFDGENASGTFNLTGGAGADTLRGSGQADTFDLSKGGADTAFGMSGNDTFNLGAAFTASDTIDGGAGTNIVVLNGDYSAGLTLGAATLTNITTLKLTGGHSYNLTTNDGNVAAAGRLIVDASSLGAGDTLTFNGTAETDGGYQITDGAGNDTITGGGGNDNITLSQGGIDAVHGGAGSDTISIGASYTAADTIDGGTGTDTLFLNNANFTLTLSGTAFQSIEGVSIGSSVNPYHLTTTDDLVGAGQTFTVGATGMGAGLTFDGSAETNGSFAISCSNFDDVIIMGGVATTVNAAGGNDLIIASHLTAADVINGGGGGNDTLELNGDFSTGFTLTANDVTNIGTVAVEAGNSYVLTLGSSALAIAQSLAVDGSALGAGNSLIFDGSQKGANNALHVTGGAGDDTVSLGAQLKATDQINGGSGGNDTLNLAGDYNGLNFNANTIGNIDTIKLGAGHVYDLILQEGNISAGQVMTVDGSLLDVNHTLEVSTTQLSHGGLNFIGGADDDEAFLGATADANTITGNGGNDIAFFSNIVAGDSFNGGTGNDELVLNGDFTAGATLGTAMFGSVETLAFDPGDSYKVTLVDGDIASGATLTVNDTGLGSGDSLIFDDSQETDGILHLVGGLATETYDLGADFTANTQIDGEAGNDTVVLNGDITMTMGVHTLLDIAKVVLSAGHNYNITANSDTDTSETEVVDASALGAGNSLHWTAPFSFYQYSYIGGAGNDVISSDGAFNMTLGGDDTLTGGSGSDSFSFGAALTSADSINGGAGTDSVSLSGDYSAGLVFGAATMTNVETLTLASGHSYNLTMNDANVASGATLTVSASGLGAANALIFDGSAETNGFYKVTGGAGNDTFIMGGALKAGDAFNGGSGSTDTLSLNGDYSSLFTFASTTMTNIDVLQLAGGHSYDLSLDDANVASSTLLTVDASALTASDALTLGTSDTNSRFAILGGAGNDFVTFGSAMSSSSTFNGGAGFDILSLGASASFTFSATTLVGVEKIQFTAGAYSLTTNDANVAAGQTLIVEASPLTASFTFNGAAETDGSFAMDGSQGIDTLTGGAQADTFTMTAGGSDTVHGGGGNDVINMGATFASGDVLDGGTGTDTVQLNGSGYSAFTFTAAELTSIEALTLTGNFNYGLTTVDANVASGATLTVDASFLTVSNTLTFNGGAETDGSFAMIGGAGNDTLTGGNQADTFDLTHGGTDTVHGGGGNDVINMGNTLTSADVVDGGTGTNTVDLSGNAYAALTLSANFTSIQDIVLGAGNSYGITTIDANVGSGASLIVDASALGAANALTFNGAAETNGTFTLIDGAGNDTLTGGALGDSFTLSGGGVDTVHGGGGNDTISVFGNFTAADTIDGGTGTDALILAGDYSGANALVLGASSMTGVEAMTLQNGFNYDITTADANIAAAATLTVTALTGAGHTVSFNGAADCDGSLAFIGGASDDSFTGGALADSFDMSHGGNDTVHGGGGNDSFTFGNAFDGNDSVDGGAGSDTLSIAEAYTGSIGNVSNVETMTLGAGFSYNLTATDGTVASGQTMTINGAAATNLTFDGSAESDGAFAVTGGSGTNNFSGGNGNDSFTLITGSNDTVHGGGGDDTMFFSTNIATGINTIDGGTGNDTLVIEIAELGNLELTGLTSVETVRFQFGDYSVYTDDATVAAGQTLTVDSTPLGTNESLTFDGSAETDGHFVFDDGVQGTLTLTGGALSDTFNLGGAVETIHAGGGDDVFYADNGIGSEDAIDGGTGNDTVIFNQNGGAFLFDSILKSVETLSFADGHTYSVTLDNGSTPTGETMTIDAGAIVTGSLTLDASDVSSKLNIIGGAGNDSLTGGAGNDTFDMTKGGNDTVHAGTGLNVVNMGTTLNGGDTIVGGGDFDTTVVIAGDNYTSLALGGTLQDIGSLQLAAGHSYTITADNTTMSDNDGLLIDGGNLGATDVLTFTDTATIDFIDVKGGAGNDVLTGSTAVEEFFLAAGGNDTVTGNGGADIFHVGTTGTDTFVYNAVSDSTSTGFDVFAGLNFDNDVFKLNTGNGVTGIDAAIASGFVSRASFDSNLAGNVTSATLAAHHAVLFSVTGGDLAGHTFLVVDQNGTAGYQASADLVMDVTGYTGTLTTADFT